MIVNCIWVLLVFQFNQNSIYLFVGPSSCFRKIPCSFRVGVSELEANSRDLDQGTPRVCIPSYLGRCQCQGGWWERLGHCLRSCPWRLEWVWFIFEIALECRKMTQVNPINRCFLDLFWGGRTSFMPLCWHLHWHDIMTSMGGESSQAIKLKEWLSRHWSCHADHLSDCVNLPLSTPGLDLSCRSDPVGDPCCGFGMLFCGRCTWRLKAPFFAGIGIVDLTEIVAFVWGLNGQNWLWGINSYEVFVEEFCLGPEVPMQYEQREHHGGGHSVKVESTIAMVYWLTGLFMIYTKQHLPPTTFDLWQVVKLAEPRWGEECLGWPFQWKDKRYLKSRVVLQLVGLCLDLVFCDEVNFE